MESYMDRVEGLIGEINQAMRGKAMPETGDQGIQQLHRGLKTYHDARAEASKLSPLGRCVLARDFQVKGAKALATCRQGLETLSSLGFVLTPPVSGAVDNMIRQIDMTPIEIDPTSQRLRDVLESTTSQMQAAGASPDEVRSTLFSILQRTDMLPRLESNKREAQRECQSALLRAENNVEKILLSQLIVGLSKMNVKSYNTANPPSSSGQNGSGERTSAPRFSNASGAGDAVDVPASAIVRTESNSSLSKVTSVRSSRIALSPSAASPAAAPRTSLTGRPSTATPKGSASPLGGQSTPTSALRAPPSSSFSANAVKRPTPSPTTSSSAMRTGLRPSTASPASPTDVPRSRVSLTSHYAPPVKKSPIPMAKSGRVVTGVVTEEADRESRRAVELRELERLEAQRMEAERREAERKEAERREAERREMERREMERQEMERREVERREAERKEMERRAMEKQEAERREWERRELEKREAERLMAAKREAERLAAEKKEAERLAAERLAAERLAAEKKKEAERARPRLSDANFVREARESDLAAAANYLETQPLELAARSSDVNLLMTRMDGVVQGQMAHLPDHAAVAMSKMGIKDDGAKKAKNSPPPASDDDRATMRSASSPVAAKNSPPPAAAPAAPAAASRAVPPPTLPPASANVNPVNTVKELRCPLCSRFMTDPVTLDCSQITYDLHCIRRYLALGHRTCPVSGTTIPTDAVARPSFHHRRLVYDLARSDPDRDINLVARESYDVIILNAKEDNVAAPATPLSPTLPSAMQGKTTGTSDAVLGGGEDEVRPDAEVMRHLSALEAMDREAAKAARAAAAAGGLTARMGSFSTSINPPHPDPDHPGLAQSRNNAGTPSNHGVPRSLDESIVFWLEKLSLSQPDISLRLALRSLTILAYKSRENQDKIAAAGGISKLLELLFTLHAKCKQSSDWAMSIAPPPHASAAELTTAMAPGRTSLPTKSNHVVLLEQVLACMRAIVARLSRAQNTVLHLKPDVVPMLFELMRHLYLGTEATKAIVNLTYLNPAVQRAFIQQGALTSLTHLLSLSSIAAGVLQQGGGGGGGGQAPTSPARSNSFPLPPSSLAPSSDTIEAAVRVLTNLCHDDEQLRDKIGEQQDPAPLLPLIIEHMIAAPVIRGTAATGLASQPSLGVGGVGLAKADARSPVKSPAREDGGDPDHYRRTQATPRLGAAKSLPTAPSLPFKMDATPINPIVTTSVLEQLVGCLRNLSFHSPRNQRRMLDCHAADAIAAVVQCPRTHVRVKMAGCAALRNIAYDKPENRVALIRAGCLGALISILDTDPDTAAERDAREDALAAAAAAESGNSNLSQASSGTLAAALSGGGSAFSSGEVNHSVPSPVRFGGGTAAAIVAGAAALLDMEKYVTLWFECQEQSLAAIVNLTAAFAAQRKNEDGKRGAEPSPRYAPGESALTTMGEGHLHARNLVPRLARVLNTDGWARHVELVRQAVWAVANLAMAAAVAQKSHSTVLLTDREFHLMNRDVVPALKRIANSSVGANEQGMKKNELQDMAKDALRKIESIKAGCVLM